MVTTTATTAGTWGSIRGRGYPVAIGALRHRDLRARTACNCLTDVILLYDEHSGDPAARSAHRSVTVEPTGRRHQCRESPTSPPSRRASPTWPATPPTWPSASACSGYQRAQVQRVELKNKLTKDLSLDQRLSGVRAERHPRASSRSTSLVERPRSSSRPPSSPSRSRLPAPVTQLTTKAREQAREVRTPDPPAGRLRPERPQPSPHAADARRQSASHEARTSASVVASGIGLPAGGRPQRPASPRSTGTSTGRTRSGSVDELEVGAGQRQQCVRHLGDGHVAARAHVVDVARRALLDSRR